VSERNVEITRSGYKRFLETGVPAREDYADDFVWDMSTFTGWPEKKTYEGFGGTMEFIAAWTEGFDDWQLEVEDYLDAGDQVVVILTQRGTARGSQMPVEMHFSQVWTLRDGKQVRMQMYASPEEGIRAAGLEPGKEKD
jgi:ketosteroid isomerase-like protein